MEKIIVVFFFGLVVSVIYFIFFHQSRYRQLNEFVNIFFELQDKYYNLGFNDNKEGKLRKDDWETSVEKKNKPLTPLFKKWYEEGFSESESGKEHKDIRFEKKLKQQLAQMETGAKKEAEQGRDAAQREIDFHGTATTTEAIKTFRLHGALKTFNYETNSI